MAEAPLRKLFLLLGVQADDKGIKKAENGLTKLKKAASVLAAVFITGALARGFKSLIDDASAASETANKFATVFGTATEEVQKQLDDTSKRTGIATLQLQQFASGIGALVKPALGSAEAAGEMGASIAELALDVASFNDVEPEAALLALRSGLIGSAEPLQQFGVDIRVAALQQEALKQGIQGSVKDMTEGQRVTLRFAAIMRQLGTQGAVGDATKTALGFANAERAVGTQLKELAAGVGSFFLKFAANAAVATRDILIAVNEWIKANKEIIQQRIDLVLKSLGRILRTVGAAISFLVTLYQNMTSEMSRAEEGVFSLGLVFLALVAILGLPVVLLIAIGVAIFLVIDDLIALGEEGESVSGILIQGFIDLIDELGGVDEAILEILATAFGLGPAFKDFGRTLFRFFDNIGRGLIGVVVGPVDVLRKLLSGDLKGAAEAAQTTLNETFGSIADNLDIVLGGAVFEGQARARLESLVAGATAGLQRAGQGLAPATVTAGPSGVSRSNAFTGGAVTTEVNINASGEAARDPRVLGDVVRREVDASNEQALRQAKDAFVTAGAG